jgi:hypothetical protein
MSMPEITPRWSARITVMTVVLLAVSNSAQVAVMTTRETAYSEMPSVTGTALCFLVVVMHGQAGFRPPHIRRCQSCP